MSRETYGEQVFRSYLKANGFELDHEPAWPHTLTRPDYRIPHPLGDVVLDIKDIEGNMFGEGRAGAYDPYELIRRKIDAAKDKFRDFSEYACVLALKAGKNSMVDLDTPEIMLGSMYGNFGFQIPIDLETGIAQSSEIARSFIRGEGKMLRVRLDGLVEQRNTRISAILTIHDYPATGRSEQPGVTVWENAFACRKLPDDLFRGAMDQWYGVEMYQTITFTGEGLS